MIFEYLKNGAGIEYLAWISLGTVVELTFKL